MGTTMTSENIARPLKILLLEDDPMDQTLIVRCLQQLPYTVEVTVATTRLDFIRTLLDFVPDIILSDYHLVQFNGLEALLLMRETFPKIPFIILSGEENPALINQWYEQGISGFLNKDDLGQLEEVLGEARSRSKHYHAATTKVRVLQQLRTNIRHLNEFGQRSEDIGIAMSPPLREQVIRDFYEVQLVLEDLYSAVQQHSVKA